VVIRPNIWIVKLLRVIWIKLMETFVLYKLCSYCHFLCHRSVLLSTFSPYALQDLYGYIDVSVRKFCGLGGSVDIATELRAGRSGIKSRWGRDFPPVYTGPRAHPASCKMGFGSFPGVKCGRGVLLTTHPLLVPRSWKSRAIPLSNLWAKPGL